MLSFSIHPPASTAGISLAREVSGKTLQSSFRDADTLKHDCVYHRFWPVAQLWLFIDIHNNRVRETDAFASLPGTVSTNDMQYPPHIEEMMQSNQFLSATRCFLLST